MGIAREKKKKTLKAKMLGILTMCAMTSLLAAGIVSYMALRMIQNDSIENNMKMYLDQITKNTDEAYYDMLSIVNYMGPGGLIGNVIILTGLLNRDLLDKNFRDSDMSTQNW